MTRKRFRTISSSSQPPVPPSQEATASQEATSQPPAHPSEQATMPSSDNDQSLNDNEIIDAADWRKVPMSIKEDYWSLMTKRFTIPEPPLGDIVKSWFLKDLGEKWRNYKYVNLEQFCKLVDFWYSDAGRHRSHAGKQNRSLQTTVHTAGSKSFARYAHELNDMVALRRWIRTNSFISSSKPTSNVNTKMLPITITFHQQFIDHLMQVGKQVLTMPMTQKVRSRWC
ncbi:hypothetical protein CJ030_MR3G015514 [Morella rubra]|uniref:Uncharacterized protein n=1 Tax=Morella rubra TaxID=262757 RepID=A0A6A1W6D0_9ROSI|nr:hypothetical protein CJ030_MR3G015514 [Morella rubra]